MMTATADRLKLRRVMKAVLFATACLAQPAFAIAPPQKVCGRIEQLSDTFMMQYSGLEGVYLELLDDRPKDPKGIADYLSVMPIQQLHRCHCLSGRSRINTRTGGQLVGSWTELSSLATCDGKPER